MDDQAILSQDKLDIHYMIRKFDEENKHRVFKLWQEYLVVGGERNDLNIGKETIKVTNAFTYLGVKITSNGDRETEIKSGVGQKKKLYDK